MCFFHLYRRLSLSKETLIIGCKSKLIKSGIENDAINITSQSTTDEQADVLTKARMEPINDLDMAYTYCIESDVQSNANS